MRTLLTACFILTLVACGGSDKNLLGETCSKDTDCETYDCLTWLPGGLFWGDLSFPGGYCTDDCFNVGLDCMDGEGICLVHNGSQSKDCYLRCAEDAECGRDDYGCFVFDEEDGACVPADIIPEEDNGESNFRSVEMPLSNK